MTNRLPMTPARWAALVIGIPLALLVIGWTALTAVAFAGLGSSRVSLAVPFHGRTAVVSHLPLRSMPHRRGPGLQQTGNGRS